MPADPELMIAAFSRNALLIEKIQPGGVCSNLPSPVLRFSSAHSLKADITASAGTARIVNLGTFL
ncbi:hypothetical protein ACKWRH_30710 [Bradyrhizobium sp. Pa8]|uniref:hypothetical protein n=1 Tax=Bradyrhizobium sp. Pa8 TaxID=3386552 RepID=UPI00403F434D